MESNPKFAVIGGGSWATAIAKMLCENQPEIAWYMWNVYAIEHLKHQKQNPNYLLNSNGLQITHKKIYSNSLDSVCNYSIDSKQWYQTNKTTG